MNSVQMQVVTIAGEIQRLIDESLTAELNRKVGVILFLYESGTDLEAGSISIATKGSKEETVDVLINYLAQQGPEMLEHVAERLLLLTLADELQE